MGNFFNKKSKEMLNLFNNLVSKEIYYAFSISILFVFCGGISIFIEKSFFMYLFFILNIIAFSLTVFYFFTKKKTGKAIVSLNYLDIFVGEISMKIEKRINNVLKLKSQRIRVEIFRGISVFFSALILGIQLLVLLRTMEYRFTGHKNIVNLIFKITQGDLKTISIFILSIVWLILIVNLISYLWRTIKLISISQEDYFKLKNNYLLTK